jgi:hypothetical protein
MSNQDQYLKLWQQKRNELQVDTNVQTDWADMQHLLNTHMPVVNPAAGGASLGKHLLTHLAKFKLLYVVAALLATGAITYLVLQNRAAIKNNRPHKIEARKDSLATGSLLNTPEDTGASNIDGQKDTLADGTLVNPGSTEPTSVNKSAEKDNANKVNATLAEKGTSNLSVDKLAKPGANSTALAKNSTNNAVAKNSIGKSNNNPTSSTPTVRRNTGHLTRNGTGSNNTKNLASGATINNGISLLHRRGSGSLNGRTTGGRSQRNTFGQGPVPNRTTTGIQSEPDLMTFGRMQGIPPVGQSFTTPYNFMWGSNNLTNNGTTALTANNSPISTHSNRISQPLIDKNIKGFKPAKAAKIKNQTPSTASLDWGILVGVNTPGSFTPKAQNKNIYGSLPVDGYTGLFATYNFSSKVAVDMQVKMLIPTNTSDSYNHVYILKTDTGATIQRTFKITDTRKIYSAQVPVHLVYNITKNISVKAGPVINLPIKHFGATSVTTATTDTLGYLKRLTDTASAISFEKKLSLGVSGGIGFTFKRLKLEGTYYRGSQPYKISSPLRSYSTNTNNVQITLGFKLNKTKP